MVGVTPRFWPESNRRRRIFLDAFKLEAVTAIRGGRSVLQVAAELGLPDRLVPPWLRWAEGQPAEASGAPRRAEPSRPNGQDRAAAQGTRARPDGARHLKASAAHLRPGDGPELSFMLIKAKRRLPCRGDVRGSGRQPRPTGSWPPISGPPTRPLRQPAAAF
jgi:transposase